MPRTDDELVDALQQATAILNGVSLRALDGTKITLRQYRVLTVLDAMGDSLTGRVAMLLGVDASTVTRFADRLTSTGHIVRQVDPAHRGRVLLCLTGKGRELVHGVRLKRREELARMMEALSVPQREILITALRTFIMAANDNSAPMAGRYP